MKQCSKCGKVLPDDFSFCPACGAAFSREPSGGGPDREAQSGTSFLSAEGPGIPPDDKPRGTGFRAASDLITPADDPRDKTNRRTGSVSERNIRKRQDADGPRNETKRRANAAIWIVSVSLLAILIVAGVFVFLGMRRSSVKKAVGQALDDQISAAVIAGDDLPLFIQYRNAVYRSAAWQVEAVDTESRTAKVAVSYVDVGALTDRYAARSADAEAFYQSCIAAIRDNTAPRREETFRIRYAGKGSSLELEDNEAFWNALSGGSLNELRGLLAGK